MTAEKNLEPMGQKDGVYFWHNICFSVEGYLFQVPQYPFIVGSGHFAEKYRLGEAADSSAGGAVMELEGVTAAQFRVFLKLLFPVHSTSTTVLFTKEEWLLILTLSTLWRFRELRKLAIGQLGCQMNDPVELIQVGRASHVAGWVRLGYEDIILKAGAITEEECDSIGDRTAIRLYIIRHEKSRGMWNTVEELIQSKFAEELSLIECQEREHLTDAELQKKQHEEIEMQAEEERKRVKEEEEERKKAEEHQRLKEWRLEEERKKAEEHQRLKEWRLEEERKKAEMERLEEERLLEIEREQLMMQAFAAEERQRMEEEHQRQEQYERQRMEELEPLISEEKRLSQNLQECMDRISQLPGDPRVLKIGKRKVKVGTSPVSIQILPGAPEWGLGGWGS